MPLQDIKYDTDLELLLKANAEECESLSLLHRISYEKYNKYSNIINVPVIILSSAIGFATGIEIGYDKINIVLGVASIFVGIIKSIDSYFALPRRAEAHRLCSLQYAQINKRIAVELSLRREQRQNPKDMLGLIKTDMKNLADIAPLIDDDIIAKFRDHYSTDGHHFPTHTANITNGLTPIVINCHEDLPPPAVGDGSPPPPVSPPPSGDIVVVEIPENPNSISGGDGAMC